MSKDYDPSLDIDAILADFTANSLPIEDGEQVKVYTPDKADTVAKKEDNVLSKVKKAERKPGVPPKAKKSNGRKIIHKEIWISVSPAKINPCQT